jgi:transaldolase
VAIPDSLKDAIEGDLQRKQAVTQSDIMALAKRGQGYEAVESLLFFTPPSRFLSDVQVLGQQLKDWFKRAPQDLQRCYIDLLVDLILGLRSFLPVWNLQDAQRPGRRLTDAQLQAEAASLQALVGELAAQAPAVAEELLAEWRAQTTARFRAEQAANPPAEAEALVGSSVSEYVNNVCAEIGSSNLRRIAEMRAAGQTLTEVSNDYASFLRYTMYLGASFVTCNPPLVDAAWAIDRPAHWTPVVDGIIVDSPEAGADALAQLVTIEVVLSNMRLLRPIFLLTTGHMGCVCLQVNPHKHGDAQAMISEALFFYEELRSRLDGGVPNVVFKLPGTRAGLEACRALTQKGIGVTITVNFGMFQHLPFAEAMHDGQCIYSNLVEMNGRLAYPVRDELLAKLDQLAAHGIDEAKGREAAAWAGVAVIKRAYRLMKERGYDLTHVKPLIASLRIYEGPMYANLPSAFPDMTEITGASILSVFPNVRRAFDARSGITLEPQQIESPVPDHILEALTHSEIFKQAYYVADRDWVPDEDERFRPNDVLALEDEAGTAAWPPVYNTLTQFCDAHDAFVQRILGRKHLLHMKQRAEAGARLSDGSKEAVVGALSNLYDVTVREALQLFCDLPRDPELLPILRGEPLRRAIDDFSDNEIAALYSGALSRHGADSGH